MENPVGHLHKFHKTDLQVWNCSFVISLRKHTIFTQMYGSTKVFLELKANSKPYFIFRLSRSVEWATADWLYFIIISVLYFMFFPLVKNFVTAVCKRCYVNKYYLLTVKFLILFFLFFFFFWFPSQSNC